MTLKLQEDVGLFQYNSVPAAHGHSAQAGGAQQREMTPVAAFINEPTEDGDMPHGA